MRFAETLLLIVSGCQFGDLPDRGQRCDRGARGGEDDEDVGAVLGDLPDVCAHHRPRVGDAVRLGVDDLARVRAEPVLQPGEVVLAEGVVLVQDADLRARLVREDVLRVELGLARVVRLPAHRPRLRRALANVVDAVAPVRVAGGEQHLRHLVLVEVLPRRQARRGTEAPDDREDVILLDELLHVRNGLGRVVPVVHGDVLDLAAMDAVVLRVDVGEERLLGRRDRLVQRRRSGVRERAADLDLLARDSRCAAPMRGGSRARCRGCGEKPDQ